MKYNLYRDPKTQQAEEEADEIIDSFLANMKKWQDKYREIGAADTASEERFAINVANRLGLQV